MFVVILYRYTHACHVHTNFEHWLKSVAAGKPSIRHHYRSHKMAVWLDLIPRIHHADTIDPSLHQLENYLNLTTFEEGGTRLVHRDSTILLAPLASPRTNTSHGRNHVLASDTTPHLSRQHSLSNIPERVNQATAPSRTSRTTKPQPRPENGVVNASMLSITVTVGCVLLMLNSLVFAATFFQWYLMGRRFRSRQTEMDKQAEVAVTTVYSDSSSRIKSSRVLRPGDGSTANCSGNSLPAYLPVCQQDPVHPTVNNCVKPNSHGRTTSLIDAEAIVLDASPCDVTETGRGVTNNCHTVSCDVLSRDATRNDSDESNSKHPNNTANHTSISKTVTTIL